MQYCICLSSVYADVISPLEISFTELATLNNIIYVTHLYKTSHMSQKHKLSFSYVRKEEKMGFNLVQKIFCCVLQTYARLNALNTKNVNARNSGSKFSLKN